jgi:hypothetical protein
MNAVRCQRLTTRWGNVFILLCLLVINMQPVQTAQAAGHESIRVGFDSITSNKVIADTARSHAMSVDANSVATLFEDDFEDGNANGWTTSGNGTWYVENGEYVVDMGNGSELMGRSTAGDINWTDFSLEVDIKGELGVDKHISVNHRLR